MLIRKSFKAEMAHCVPGAYTQRCHYLHGHTYHFDLFLKGHRPNPAHMVADFRGIKAMGMSDYFDSFDHALVVWEKDPLVKILKDVNPQRHIVIPFLPTAEMLAKASFVACQAIVETGPKLSGEVAVEVDHVVVHETATSSASFGLSDVQDDAFPDIQFERWIFSDGIKSSWKQKGWYEKVLRHLSSDM